MVKRIALACALLALAALLVAPYARYLVPSRLTVHAPQQRSVSVDGVPVPVSTTVASVSPLAYGPHVLRVGLGDGRVVWVAFFHADAGADRRVDIYVNCRPGTERVQVRQTITRYGSLQGVTRTVFIGQTRPEDTSQAKPLVTDWI